MLCRLALTALLLADRDADCELESVYCGGIIEVFCTIVPAACRPDELSVRGAMLRDGSLDSAAMNATITSLQCCACSYVQDLNKYDVHYMTTISHKLNQNISCQSSHISYVQRIISNESALNEFKATTE